MFFSACVKMPINSQEELQKAKKAKGIKGKAKVFYMQRLHGIEKT